MGLPIMILLVWMCGFLWFLSQIPSQAGATAYADAAVVLTGGQDRLQKGVQLLIKKHVTKLFVSGVSSGVDTPRLLALANAEVTPNLLCCIEVGHQATNTQENALETAHWLHRQKDPTNITKATAPDPRTHDEYQETLVVVTAAYHMPRAKLEFQTAMPHVKVISYPVFTHNFPLSKWPTSWSGQRLAFKEYHKYLLTRARMFYHRMLHRLLRPSPPPATYAGAYP